MKILRLLILAVTSASALGQATVTVTASRLGPVTGTITFQPALVDGTPASTQLGGGGITSRQPVTAAVTAGAFSLTAINTAASNPANLCYVVTVKASNGLQVLGPGFSCVQPAYNNSWCVNGVCNFDNYVPYLPGLALVTPGATGATGPQGAAGLGVAVRTSTPTPYSTLAWNTHLGEYDTVTPPANAFAYLFAFGDSISCGYWAAGPNGSGSPPYAIAGPYCYQDRGWPYLIQAQTGIPSSDYAIPADQACDIWVRQIAPQNVSPSVVSTPLLGSMIGTNDANAKGAGAYEVNFNTCQQAYLTWLGIPVEFKTLPAAASLSGSFVVSNTTAIGAYVFTAASGTAVFPITTYGGPIYLWHTVNDSTTGSATYSVDGGGSGSFNTKLTTAMNTQNGTTNSVGVERLTGVAAGNHNVTITWTSGQVAVLGVGTPPLNTYYGHPTQVVMDIPLPLAGTSGAYLTARTAYNADIAANVALLAGDGLDIRYCPNDLDVTGATAYYTDGFHPTPLGGQGYANAVLRCAQPSVSSPARKARMTTAAATYSVTGGTVSGYSGLAGTIPAGSPGLAIPITTTGNIEAITLNVATLPTGASFSLAVATCTGCSGAANGASVTFAYSSPFTITPTTTGEQTFYAGRDFTAPSVTSGQYLYVYSTNAKVGYLNNGSTGPGWVFTPATSLPASGATWTYNTLYRLDLAVNVGGTVSSSSAGTSDTVSVLGMTAAGYCAKPSPTNALAASGELTAPAYVSGKSAGSVTVTHAATAGMAYDLMCWAY